MGSVAQATQVLQDLNGQVVPQLSGSLPLHIKYARLLPGSPAAAAGHGHFGSAAAVPRVHASRASSHAASEGGRSGSSTPTAAAANGRPSPSSSTLFGSSGGGKVCASCGTAETASAPLRVCSACKVRLHDARGYGGMMLGGVEGVCPAKPPNQPAAVLGVPAGATSRLLALPQAAAYCSSACQMRDWQARHSTECGALQDLARLFSAQPGVAATLAAALEQPGSDMGRAVAALLQCQLVASGEPAAAAADQQRQAQQAQEQRAAEAEESSGDAPAAEAAQDALQQLSLDDTPGAAAGEVAEEAQEVPDEFESAQGSPPPDTPPQDSPLAAQAGEAEVQQEGQGAAAGQVTAE